MRSATSRRRCRRDCCARCRSTRSSRWARRPPVRVDVRVLAATHRDLPDLVRQGRFREDLYYRLNVVTLTLPPLRARRQDIPLLIDHFLRELTSRHGRGPVAVDPEAQRRLLAYDWPGNIRELQNVLERAMLLAEQDVIGPEHLTPVVRGADGAAPDSPLAILGRCRPRCRRAGRCGCGRPAPVAGGGRPAARAAGADRPARQSRRDVQGPRHQPPHVEPDDSALEPAPPLRLKPLCPARDRVARHGPSPRARCPLEAPSRASHRWHMACLSSGTSLTAARTGRPP